MNEAKNHTMARQYVCRIWDCVGCTTLPIDEYIKCTTIVDNIRFEHSNKISRHGVYDV